MVWYSNNSNIVTVSSYGIVTAIKPGSTNVIASLGGKSTSIAIIVSEITSTSSAQTATESGATSTQIQSEQSNPDTNTEEQQAPTLSESPDNPDDSFLNSSDHFTLSLGTNGGYPLGDDQSVLYGPPADVSDTLSLGVGGSITIELSDYIIVNDPGADFTIFENMMFDYMECAKVSVSNDGTHYYEFTCNPNDNSGEFSGCAGVQATQYGLNDDEYLDPNLSGGDAFDLDNLEIPELNEAHYIRIEDIGLCQSNETTLNHGYNGFDLEALAIVHGRNTN